LHFLGTPQAFVLSQDQTLHKKSINQNPKALAMLTLKWNVWQYIPRQ
jgi:hypothetical protein